MKCKNVLFIAFFSLLVFASSCNKKDLNSINEIKYGTSFGMCIGYCKNELVIKGKQAIFTRRKNGNEKETISCVNQLKEDTLNEIMNNINLNYFNNSPNVIGCPDCADGGSEYVEINNDGNIKRITFEYGKPPKQLEDLVKKLKVQFKAFENCN